MIIKLQIKIIPFRLSAFLSNEQLIFLLSHQAFVSCTQGVQTIGFVMTAYGVSGGLSALLLGVISKYTGRLPIFTAGFISQMVLMIMMMVWDPHQGEVWHLYLMAITWAFGGALRESQIAGKRIMTTVAFVANISKLRIILTVDVWGGGGST